MPFLYEIKNPLVSRPKGNPFKLILAFLIPVVLGELMQQVYSVVDAAIVGRYLGVIALGGVGATGSLSFLVVGFCNGLCNGFALPVAQAFGAGDHARLRRYVALSTKICVIAAAIILAVVLPLTGKIIRLMQIPEEQFDFAYNYIFVIFCGIPATILYNFTAGIIRSLGDSKTPVIFLAIASVLNIAGDLLCICVLNMGVSGAALATVVSQLISGLLCLFYMRRKFPILHLEKDDRKWRKQESLYLLSNGVPMGLQFSITAVGVVILQTGVNTLGALSVSAIATSHKVYQVLAVPYQAIMSASATFTGQNLGAKKFDRIKQGVGAACLILAVCWIFEVILVTLAGDRLFLLFLTEEDLALVSRQALQCLTTFCYSFILLIPVNVMRLSIQGMSFSKLALVAGFIEMLARIFTGLVLIPNFGFTGACFSNFCAWLAADLFLIPAFFICLEKRPRWKYFFPVGRFCVMIDSYYYAIQSAGLRETVLLR